MVSCDCFCANSNCLADSAMAFAIISFCLCNFDSLSKIDSFLAISDAIRFSSSNFRYSDISSSLSYSFEISFCGMTDWDEVDMDCFWVISDSKTSST